MTQQEKDQACINAAIQHWTQEAEQKLGGPISTQMMTTLAGGALKIVDERLRQLGLLPE